MGLEIANRQVVISSKFGSITFEVNSEGGGNYLNLVKADLCDTDNPHAENGFHLDTIEEIDEMAMALKELINQKEVF